MGEESDTKNRNSPLTVLPAVFVTYKTKTTFLDKYKVIKRFLKLAELLEEQIKIMDIVDLLVKFLYY